MKLAVNNVAIVVQGLEREMARLIEASHDGRLSDRRRGIIGSHSSPAGSASGRRDRAGAAPRQRQLRAFLDWNRAISFNPGRASCSLLLDRA